MTPERLEEIEAEAHIPENEHDHVCLHVDLHCELIAAALEHVKLLERIKQYISSIESANWYVAKDLEALLRGEALEGQEQ